MKYLHKLINSGLILVFALILASCSGGGNTPVQTNPDSGISNSSQDNFSSSGEIPETSIDENDSNRMLLGMYTVEFDPQLMITTVQPNRSSMAHYDVTTYLPPQISIISVDTLTNIWTVRITINNTFPINGYDLRLIVYTDNSGIKLQNPDNWTAIWDIPGGMQINPFIAFSKSDSERKFKAGASYSEIVQVYMPVLAPVKLAVDVSYPTNCLEPYEITHSVNGTLYDKGNESVNLQARVNDHQRDVNQVVLYCPAITGVTYAPLSKFSNLIWELNLENTNHAAKGRYTAVLIASSTGSGTIALYDLFTLEVEHTGFPNEVEFVNTWAASDVYYGSGGCNAVCFDNQDNIYAGGCFEYTVDFGDGNPIASLNNYTDGCLVKYNEDGSFGWVKLFASRGYSYNTDTCNAVVFDGFDSIAAAGSFESTIDFGDGPRYNQGSSDCFVAKYNTDGTYQWAKTFGGSDYDSCSSLAADGDGNIYVAGNFYSTVDFGGGPVTAVGERDSFVCKFNADGSFAWVKTIGGPGYDSLTDLVTSGDKLYLCGNFSGTVDFGDGNPKTANGDSDAFVLVLDTSKAFVDLYIWGSPDWDEVASLAVDSSNNIFATGYFETETDFGGGPITSKGGEDCYLLKLDSGCNFYGAVTWGSLGYEETYGLAIGKAGDVYVAGYFEGVVDFGDGISITPIGSSDGFICKFSPAGTFKGVKTFGGPAGWTYVFSIDATTDGDICYGGNFDSTIDFGDGNPIDPHSGLAAYVVNLNDLE